MRGATAGLLLLGAAVWVGCGGEEGGASVERAQVPEVAADAASPLARAFTAWRTQRPQHLSLSITHVVQPQERYWTGSIEEWSRSTARVGPLEVEVWIGKQDQVVIAPGNEQQLAFHRSSGAPLIQVGQSPGQSRLIPVVLRSPKEQREISPSDGKALGWSATGMPDPQMLAADLTRLLDLSALADWLEAVPSWSTALADGGTQHAGMARRQMGSGWGAVQELNVGLVLDYEARLLVLTIEVRRERGSRMRVRAATGDVFVVLPPPSGGGDRWADPFPLAALRPPGEVLGPSLPEGDPRLSDPAHERTVYVLRPASGPISAELERFLSARRVVR